MNRLIQLLVLIIVLSSCQKSVNDFIWERTYGSGKGYFIKSAPDSGFVACGEVEGKPYFIRLNKHKSTIIDFKSDNPGLFSSAWFDTSGYVTAGNTDGKMLLMRYSAKGKMLWEKSLDAGFKVDFTNLFYSGYGNLLAIGTASPDSVDSGPTGLMFVRFDTTGLVVIENKIPETSFISANNAIVDGDGNIFLALTRKYTGSKSKASVAKFNNLFQKFWETDLYNNPDFGAAALAIESDGSGNVDVAGTTEVLTNTGKLNNSFLVSLTGDGTINWKKYLESSNYGTAVVFNSGDLLMLNRNCFIVNIVNPADGSDAGRIQMFSLCDSYHTDALGTDMEINFDKNILVSGARGGSFYLALKSAN
jgi:hypothetical protein